MRMRYVLIGLASLASASLWWIAWRTWGALTEPPAPGYMRGEGLEIIGALFAGAAVIVGVAAIGMLRRRAWGAYLFSVSAFLASAVLAIGLLFSLGAWDVSEDPTSLNLMVLVILVVAIWAGVMAIRLGRSLRASTPDSPRLSTS
jgi:photosystem I reaction center subunit XII